MSDQSLKSLFSAAEALRRHIESSFGSNPDARQQQISDAVAAYEECRVLADRMSLFSPNETLEDITSGDLQYLLINYRQAELLLTTNGVERKLTLKAAREAFERYLSLLDHYEILSTAEKKLYNDYTEGPTAFSTMSSSDPAANRGAKIANFKLKKELEGQIEVLNGFKWSSRFILTDPQSLYSKSATNNVQRLSQDAAYLENDEDKVRELQLASLALCTHTTFQSLETINRELAVLAMAPAVPISRPDPSSLAHDYRERMGMRNGEDYSDRLDIRSILSATNPGPILNSSGKPLRPFTLLDSRQTVQNGVFKSGHNLPTMTIDEYLEEEKARGGIIEGGGEASGIVPEPEEDNYEKGEEETIKARAWDDFCEENPKGAGNTLNRG